MNELICESFTACAIRKIEDVQNDIETAISYATDNDYIRQLEAVCNDLERIISKLV